VFTVIGSKYTLTGVVLCD